MLARRVVGGTTIVLKPAVKSAARVLDELAAGLTETGQSRVVDSTSGTFMAVHVEITMRDEGGAVFSVAHYFEANGDLVADPESYCAVLTATGTRSR